MKKIKIRTKNEYVIENNSIRKLKALNINFLNIRNQKTIEIDSITAQIDNLHLTTRKTSKKTASNFKQTQNFFHFTNYQRKNLEKTCDDLKIE